MLKIKILLIYRLNHPDIKTLKISKKDHLDTRYLWRLDKKTDQANKMSWQSLSYYFWKLKTN